MKDAHLEADLVRRCAEGDEEAWAAFVDGYGSLLTALARKMLRRRFARARDEDADEIVAEVFLALLRRDRLLLHRYDSRWRLSTYLGVLCRTQTNRWMRRRRRAGETLEGPERLVAPPSAVDGPLASLAPDERREALEALREGLSGLSARDRHLLTLRFLEGLDYASIAAALGLRASSIGSLLSRAKTRLAGRVEALRPLLED